MSTVARRTLLAAALLLVGALFLLSEPVGADGPAAEYELGGRILTRVHEDGRLEFCFQPTGGETICPTSRFLSPERAATDRWIASSRMDWSVALDAEQVAYPAAAAPVYSDPSTCVPDVERMFGAVWQVQTTRASGTAFHIGGGRFLTAAHVVRAAPPFVTLTHPQHGELAAAVLAADAGVDTAVLGIYDHEVVNQLPSVALRDASADDLGAEVFYAGYPYSGPLTLARGGKVTRVWEDEIRTTVTFASGGSGGPVLDACGAVLGVHWGGSTARTYGHGGAGLARALAALDRQWPALPEQRPAALNADGRLLWHYAAEPPAEVACAGVEGDWWLGVAGGPPGSDLSSAFTGGGWELSGRCGSSNGPTYVLAFSNDGAGGAPPPPTCVADQGRDGNGRISEVLHRSTEPFGEVQLATLGATTSCPWQFNVSLRVDLAELVSGAAFAADLIGADGRVIAGTAAGREYQRLTERSSSATEVFWQRWEVPEEFEPSAVRLSIGEREWSVGLERLLDGAALAQAGWIVTRVDGESGIVRVCLQRQGRGIACPEPAGRIPYAVAGDRWIESAALRWTVRLPREALPSGARDERATLAGCALDQQIGEAAWQFESLNDDGTAIYVGRGQFLVDNALIGEHTPWGAVSRGDLVLPVVRVAIDERNGLALLEVIGDVERETLGRAAGFGRTGDSLAGERGYLVSYRPGDLARSWVTAIRLDELSARLIELEALGTGRDGAALVDPCTDDLLGMVIRRTEVLRSETLGRALLTLRRNIERPQLPVEGTALLGSAAAWPLPLYVGEVQPRIGGSICNVRMSERYERHYAVFVARIDGKQLISVVDGERVTPRRCGSNDKVFLISWRADEVPETICVEPTQPSSPRSTLDWELEAPAGIALQQAVEFRREPCPGLPESYLRWDTTHFLQLRNTGEIEFDDLQVRLEDGDGERLEVTLTQVSDVDPDVRSWRVRVAEGVPARVVVTEE